MTQKTIDIPPSKFLYINPTYLLDRGYISKFTKDSYFSTMAPLDNENGRCFLSAVFTKGNIKIYYGLFYKDLPPMVISIFINNKRIYLA